MSRAATARLFVAVDPPLAVCEELAAWARAATRASLGAKLLAAAPAGSAPAVRTLEAGSLHLTLCFLGARPVEEIAALAAALRECEGCVGELSVGAPLLLPPRRPRALAVEIHDPGGELATLRSRLVSLIVRASDWEPARRERFRPHVTVARIRAGTRWTPAQALSATPQLRFTPRTVSLDRSWLAPAGASYEAVASVELAASAG